MKQLRTAARSAEASGDWRGRVHAALALLHHDPTQAPYLVRQLLRPDIPPDHLLVISRRLGEELHAEKASLQLWKTIEEQSAAKIPGRQLRAAAALAALDSANHRWIKIAPAVCLGLVRENPLLLDSWREVFQPVSRELLGSLRAIYSSGATLAERAHAFTLLFNFATQPGNRTEPEDLTELIAGADPDQFRMIIEKISEQDRAVAHLSSLVEDSIPRDDAAALHRSRLILALVSLGRNELFWKSLLSTEGPGLRTYLIHDCHRFGIHPRVLIDRLRSPSEASLERAILLALGEYPIGQINPDDLRFLIGHSFEISRPRVTLACIRRSRGYSSIVGDASKSLVISRNHLQVTIRRAKLATGL